MDNKDREMIEMLNHGIGITTILNLLLKKDIITNKEYEDELVKVIDSIEDLKIDNISIRKILKEKNYIR